MHHNSRQTFVCGQTFMIGLRAAAVVLILAMVVPTRGQAPASSSPIEEKPRQWHKYANNKYGFSFWYPDPYRPVPLPPLDAGDKFRQSANYERRLLLLERRDNPDARIWIRLELRPFNLHALWQSHAPTGYDEDKTPAPKQIGKHTFYCYGAGVVALIIRTNIS